MASRSTHPVGKPAGLSPADLQRHAKPAAYLTSSSLPNSGLAGRLLAMTKAPQNLSKLVVLE
jgi:hypothetical protein